MTEFYEYEYTKYYVINILIEASFFPIVLETVRFYISHAQIVVLGEIFL
jgi:hypothetical protein